MTPTHSISADEARRLLAEDRAAQADDCAWDWCVNDRKPGWRRIGNIDDVRRRSLWVRWDVASVELCSGREGDDNYVRIDASNPQYNEIADVLSRAIWAPPLDGEGMS